MLTNSERYMASMHPTTNIRPFDQRGATSPAVCIDESCCEGSAAGGGARSSRKGRRRLLIPFRDALGAVSGTFDQPFLRPESDPVQAGRRTRWRGCSLNLGSSKTARKGGHEFSEKREDF